MPDLSPQTALGNKAPLRSEIGGLCVLERTDLAFASVTARLGQRDACALELSDILGAPAPGIGRACLHTAVSAFWTGADQWMVSAPFETHERVDTILSSKLRGLASITEQTDGWAVFDISGDQCVDAFERLCAAPVRKMRGGDVQRSTIHHLSCFVLCTDTGREIRVFGPRSSAGSLHHALCTAARSVA